MPLSICLLFSQLFASTHLTTTQSFWKILKVLYLTCSSWVMTVIGTGISIAKWCGIKGNVTWPHCLIMEIPTVPIAIINRVSPAVRQGLIQIQAMPGLAPPRLNLGKVRNCILLNFSNCLSLLPLLFCPFPLLFVPPSSLLFCLFSGSGRAKTATEVPTYNSKPLYMATNTTDFFDIYFPVIECLTV